MLQKKPPCSPFRFGEAGQQLQGLQPPPDLLLGAAQHPERGVGNKDAPLGNISAKTYLLKMDLKVIKKKKLGRRKPEASSPSKHAGGVLHLA